MDWSTDMSKAPRGRFRVVVMANGKGTRRVFEPAEIVVAGACGVVTVSHWLDDEKRFSMFTAERPPIAWRPYAGPRVITENGKTRHVVDLPAHPTMSESWFSRLLRERRAAA